MLDQIARLEERARLLEEENRVLAEGVRQPAGQPGPPARGTREGNVWLKRLAADKELDIAILKEVSASSCTFGERTPGLVLLGNAASRLAVFATSFK